MKYTELTDRGKLLKSLHEFFASAKNAYEVDRANYEIGRAFRSEMDRRDKVRAKKFNVGDKVYVQLDMFTAEKGIIEKKLIKTFQVKLNDGRTLRVYPTKIGTSLVGESAE